MARITVEDCLDKIPNRFELVAVTSKRARQLEIGADEPHVDWENDKPTVVALREIADNKIGFEILTEKKGELIHQDPSLTVPAGLDLEEQRDVAE